jgi:hypothetical protein
MTTTIRRFPTTLGNSGKVPKAQAALNELLCDAVRPGFHGRAVLEITVQDGTIQHIRKTIEKLVK